MPPHPNAVNIVAKELLNGEPIQSALLAGGYSPNQAKRGKAGIPKKVWRALSGEAQELIRLGKRITADEQESLVRGRLAMNTIRGKDAGVMSAKALGSDKRVNMFAAELQNANIVIVPTLPGQALAKPLLREGNGISDFDTAQEGSGQK